MGRSRGRRSRHHHRRAVWISNRGFAARFASALFQSDVAFASGGAQRECFRRRRQSVLQSAGATARRVAGNPGRNRQTMRRLRTLLSWSSGKDSAWTLHTLRSDARYDVVALVTTINSAADRVAMHAVRTELLRGQARAAGLELWELTIPSPCSNEEYEAVMRRALAREMIAGGLRARITCVDPRLLPSSFAGREFDLALLDDLPASVDPCGER